MVESGTKSMFYYSKASYVFNCQHFKKRYKICFNFTNFTNFTNFINFMNFTKFMNYLD